MPSKSEIKKSPKSVKSTKPKVVKKAVVEPKSLKAKTVTKSVTKVEAKPKVAKAPKSRLADAIVASPIVPSLEDITKRAHQIWLDEGCPEGRADLHWEQAQRELSAIS
jgi:hypothetical protein